MDDDHDFTELEAELRQLRPAALTVTFLSRVERSLAEPSQLGNIPRRNRVSEWLAWPVAAGFVCAVAWLSGGARLDSNRPMAGGGGTTTTSIYKPVGAENILYDVREEGLTALADGTPARQVRDRYLDVITWKNAAASSVCWSVPRDEVRLIPVEAY